MTRTWKPKRVVRNSTNRAMATAVPMTKPKRDTKLPKLKVGHWARSASGFPCGNISPVPSSLRQSSWEPKIR